MNIDETMRSMRKKYLKIKGIFLQITHISAAYSPYVRNMMPTYCLKQPVYLNGNICLLSHLGIS